MILGTLIELPFFKPQVIQYIKLDFFQKYAFVIRVPSTMIAFQKT